MKKILLATVSILSLARTAMADGADVAGPFNPGDIMLRARAIDVRPDVSSSLSIGGTVSVNNNTVPEIDASYFFTPQVSAELIAAVTRHNVTTNTGVNAGSAWLLPPTLTLQYHFTQYPDVAIPYVGAGINYTHFFDATGGALNAAHYDDSVGPALQAGIDVPIKGNWYANLDVKKLYISTTAKFSPSGVRADVDINPWVIGAGVGYKF